MSDRPVSALEAERLSGPGDAQDTVGSVALRWYTEVTHATGDPVGYGVGAMVLREEVWTTLSAEDQKAEKKISRKIGKKLIKRVRKDNKRAMKAMQKELGTETPLFGCYCAGEIGPADTAEKNEKVLSSGVGWHVMFTVLAK